MIITFQQHFEQRCDICIRFFFPASRFYCSPLHHTLCPLLLPSLSLCPACSSLHKVISNRSVSQEYSIPKPLKKEAGFTVIVRRAASVEVGYKWVTLFFFLVSFCTGANRVLLQSCFMTHDIISISLVL